MTTSNTAKASVPTSVKLSALGLVILTVCTMMTTLMQALDGTIANVALPYMQGSMAASQTQINWVLTSYIIATAIMMAPTGFLVSRFGRTRLFIASIAGFTIASVLCGAAQSLGEIVLCRILQGACGASLVPLSQAVLFDIYPLESRGPAMALWAVGVQIGPVLGPILGGWLTEDYSWRWVFYINVPIGVAAATGLLVFLKETPRAKSFRLDWIGFIALSVALASFQLMLDRGQTLDWFSSPEIVTEACLSAFALYIFIVQSSTAPKPFLSPRLFKDINFVVAVSLIFVIGLILFATLALLAPYLQTLMNFPVITAGVILAPRGIGTIVALVLCGQLLRKIDIRLLVGFGFLISALALYRMTFWTTDVSQWEIVGTGLIQGFATGFVFVPLSATAFATLPAELRTEAAGIFNLMRNLGSAVGISITGALLVRNDQLNHAIISAVVTPFNHALQRVNASRIWDPASFHGAAALNEEINRQASVISYIDNFKLMLVLSLSMVPIVFLIRPPRAASAKQLGTAALK